MPCHFRDLGDALEWRARGEILRVEAWGPDSVRVRVTPGGPLLDDLPGALLDTPPDGGKPEISIDTHHATLVNGTLTVRIDASSDSQVTPELPAVAGRLTFLEPAMTGLANEVWSYGEEVYPILADHLRMRERLRPYVMRQMRIAAATGLPPMRPVLLEFPDDPRAWQVEDAFLLGPDLLVAPITEAGVRERAVYLPVGVRWTDAWTGEEHTGGQTVTAAAPIERIPLFLRADARLPVREQA